MGMGILTSALQGGHNPRETRARQKRHPYTFNAAAQRAILLPDHTMKKRKHGVVHWAFESGTSLNLILNGATSGPSNAEYSNYFITCFGPLTA